jgi:hypothetical protein
MQERRWAARVLLWWSIVRSVAGQALWLAIRVAITVEVLMAAF